MVTAVATGTESLPSLLNPLGSLSTQYLSYSKQDLITEHKRLPLDHNETGILSRLPKPSLGVMLISKFLILLRVVQRRSVKEEL